MKKIFVLLVAVFLFSAAPVGAANLEVFDETVTGAKIDLPNLVKKDKHSLGVEISITDITNDWKDGSQVFLKYTYTGSIFDFSN